MFVIDWSKTQSVEKLFALTLEEWLRSIDESLLVYCSAISKDFDSVRQVFEFYMAAVKNPSKGTPS